MTAYLLALIAVVLVSGIVAALIAFKAWLDARYPEAVRDADPGIGARLTAVEERLSTIELQRAILRKVPNK